jgi:hypothetical protein
MRIRPQALVTTLIVWVIASCAHAPIEQPVSIAPTAPRDNPAYVTTDTAMAQMAALLEPCRRKALGTWPGARSRFQAGLPQHQSLFVTTRLHDARGRMEQVFVAVDRIERDSVAGRVWSDIAVVQGFRRGQQLVIPESDIVDWMISKPDGSEEGNLMGKFIDAGATSSSGICD